MRHVSRQKNPGGDGKQYKGQKGAEVSNEDTKRDESERTQLDKGADENEKSRNGYRPTCKGMLKI